MSLTICQAHFLIKFVAYWLEFQQSRKEEYQTFPACLYVSVDKRWVWLFKIPKWNHKDGMGIAQLRKEFEDLKLDIERFPEDFMFQLTKGEYEILTNDVLKSQFDESKTIGKKGNHILTSQIVISSYIDKTKAPENQNWGGSRKTPYAFTENGVAMLSF